MKTIEEIQEEKQIPAARKSIGSLSRIKRRVIAAGLILLLLLLLLAAAWITGMRQSKELLNQLHQENARLSKEIEDLKNNPIVVNPVAPEISMQVLSSEIREIGELATAEYLFTDAFRFSDSKQIKNWNIPFTQKSFICKWSGIIKAGVDITTISIELKEEGETKTLAVTLPAAKILSYEIDETTFEMLDEKNNIFNPISITDKVDVDAATKEAMKNRAIENGLLEKAQKNAEVIITDFLLSKPEIAGYYKIQFVTE